MEITALNYGESVLPESMIFENGDPNAVRDIIFRIYLVKEDNKLILIDAGCETMPGFDMKSFIGSVRALKNIGISPEDITDVIVTHSHHDHIECVKHFKNAVIHIEKREYKNGKKYIPKNFKINTFSDKLCITDSIKIISIGGHSEGSCIVQAKSCDKTYIFAGDECYIRECLTKKIPTGASCCRTASRKFVEKYSDESRYTVFLSHDN